MGQQNPQHGNNQDSPQKQGQNPQHQQGNQNPNKTASMTSRTARAASRARRDPSAAVATDRQALHETAGICRPFFFPRAAGGVPFSPCDCCARLCAGRPCRHSRFSRRGSLAHAFLLQRLVGFLVLDLAARFLFRGLLRGHGEFLSLSLNHGRPLSGLSGAPRCAVNLARRITGIVGGELNVDRCEFRGLARASERRVAAELFQLFFSFSIVAPPDTCNGVQIGPGATPFTEYPSERTASPTT